MGIYAISTGGQSVGYCDLVLADRDLREAPGNSFALFGLRVDVAEHLMRLLEADPLPEHAHLGRRSQVVGTARIRVDNPHTEEDHIGDGAVAALSACMVALAALSNGDRWRIVDWLADKYPRSGKGA